MTFYDKVRRQKFLSFSLVLFTLAIGVLIGTVIQTGAKAAKEQFVASDARPLSIPSPVQMQNEFSRIAKRLEPSVVNISTEYIPKVQVSDGRTPQRNQRRRAVPQAAPDDDDNGDDNGLQQFFRFFNGPGGGGGASPFGEQDDSPSAALGSGVVVDSNGYILTNNHVVEKATRIKVKFNNDSEDYPATVVGTDKETDLAVIKVSKKNLIAAKIGNSDAVQVGDWAMAIGSPFGFQATVTAGIVSALSRDVPGEGRRPSSFQHFIQTDAAINPGNSGGPLLNINGEVIGINTMIASRSGGYQGIGFAMPINTAVKVYNDIIRTGQVTRGSIGISFNDVPENSPLLEVYGAKNGVFVAKVEADGPAEKAGLKVEDVITSISGKPVKKGQDLIDQIADSPIGSTVQVGVVRGKKPMTLSVTVGDRAKVFAEEFGGTKSLPTDSPAEKTTVRFGMTLQPVRPTDREQLGFKGTGGALVSAVEVGSFADEIGLAKGDIIVQMNRQAINSPDDLKRLQGSLKAHDAVVFQVMRRAPGARGGGDWQPLYLSGRVPETNQ